MTDGKNSIYCVVNHFCAIPVVVFAFDVYYARSKEYVHTQVHCANHKLTGRGLSL